MAEWMVVVTAASDGGGEEAKSGGRSASGHALVLVSEERCSVGRMEEETGKVRLRSCGGNREEFRWEASRMMVGRDWLEGGRSSGTGNRGDCLILELDVDECRWPEVRLGVGAFTAKEGDGLHELEGTVASSTWDLGLGWF